MELSHYIKIIDTLPVGVVIYTKEGEIYNYNQYFIKLFGYTIDDIKDVNEWFSEVYPDDEYRKLIEKNWNEAIEEYYKTGSFRHFEAKVKCKDGSYKYIEFGFEMLGELILTTFFDVSKRVEAEEEKNKTDRKYKIISDLITDYIFVVDVGDDGKLTFQWASENLQRITGRNQTEVGGLENWMKIVHPDYLEQLGIFIKKIIVSDLPDEFECKSYTKNGDIRWINIYAQRIWNQETGRYAIIGAVKDINRRKKAEEALKDSEEKYRNLIENVNEVIYIHDIEGVFTYVSPQAEIIFGYHPDELIGKPWQIISTEHAVNTKSWGKVLRHFETKSTHPMTNIYEIINKKGTLMFLEATERVVLDKYENVIGVIGSVRDITQRKKLDDEIKNHRNRLEILVNERTEELQVMNEELRSVNEELYYANEQLENQKAELNEALNKLKETQAQLIQTEKMASLGVLTAGVAHEINNPLNFIQAGIYKLEDIRNELALNIGKDELNSIFLDALNYIDTGVKRASEIVKSLTRLSRKSTDEKLPCNLHSIIESSLLILNYEIKYKCNVIKDFYPIELVIPGFEGKLHQVFLNLLVNSLQAMESGVITIKTDFNIDKNCVNIFIKDTGKGIEESNLNKIFDPFFTTKAPGQGTGLGLSIVYSIIKEHNGFIEFKSEVGKGTEVLITLPA